MAFTSSKQLFHFSFCSSDCQNRFVGQERETSSVKDRLTCLQRYNKGANSWDPAPLMVSKALRENEQVPSLPLQTFAILDVDSEADLSSKALSDMKDLLMDLRRSLLESQWALPSNSAHLPPITVPVKEGLCSSECLRLGRPSARERRIEARKKRKQKDGKSLAAMSSPTVRRQTLSSRIEKPSDSVSSVIELISGKGRKTLLSKEEETLLSKTMKVGEKLRAAKRKLTNILGCEPADEIWASTMKLSVNEVYAKIQEADRARDKMFISNLRLVVSVAQRYRGHGVTLSDLIQEGALGLLRGIEKFDHRKGFKLSTYVHWWIWQGITRAIGEHSRTVRIPGHMIDRINLVNRTVANMRQEGEEVSVQKISKVLNMPDEMITVAIKAIKRVTSLDQRKRWGGHGFHPDSDSMHSYIGDTRLDNDPWDALSRMSLQEDVQTLMANFLSEREREILRLHYHLDSVDGPGLSLEKISHRFGISRERTRQVRRLALRKLAASCRGMDLEHSLNV